MFGKILKYAIIIGGFGIVGYLIYLSNNKTSENLETSKLESQVDSLCLKQDSLTKSN